MIFLREENQALAKKEIKVPDKLVDLAKEINASIGAEYPRKEGAKRIKKIALGNGYTKQNKANDDRDGVYLSFAEVKRADHEMRHENPKSVEYMLNGGDEYKNLYSHALDIMRNSVKENPIVKAVKPNRAALKKSLNAAKPMEINKLKIHLEGKEAPCKSVIISESQLEILKKNIK